MKFTNKYEMKFNADGLMGKTVVVGFSGGADSISLLHYLKIHETSLNCKVRAVHINHCLRGEESIRDETFVKRFCEDYQIPLTVQKVDIRSISKETGESEEVCGREARYHAFAEEAAAIENAVIATAHTLSDDFETTLFHMIRGCTLDGLCGIPQNRYIAEDTPVYRPLLSIVRAEVEEYCRENGLSFMTDSTNLSDDYSRNYLRLEIIPRLKKLNPSLEKSYLRMRESLTADRVYLNEERDLLLEKSQTGHGWKADEISSASEAVKKRVCAEILRKEKCPVDYVSVNALANVLNNETRGFETGNKRFAVRGGLMTAESTYHYVGKAVSLPQIFPSKISVVFEREDTNGTEINNFQKMIYFYLLDREMAARVLKVYKKLLYFSVDYDTIRVSDANKSKIMLRTRLPGDMICLPGRNGHKPIKKLFQEAHLSGFERETRLILADNREVIWLEGFGLDSSRPELGNETLIAAKEELPVNI